MTEDNSEPFAAEDDNAKTSPAKKKITFNKYPRRDEENQDREEIPSAGSSVGIDERPSVSPQQLHLHLSASLVRKLQSKAIQEGVSIHDLAGELIAEGLVLRAWEIMERKVTMKGPGQPGNFPQKPGQGRFNNTPRNNTRSRPTQGVTRRQNQYNQIMDDSANFLEYVRNQEKKQSR